MEFMNNRLKRGSENGEQLMLFLEQFQNLETEQRQLEFQNQQLSEENLLLRNALQGFQQQLFAAEAAIAQLQHEKEYMKLTANASSWLMAPSKLPDPSAEELKQRPSVSAISWEKIQKQVLKYVSEGRHEMAILLCKEAVAELEIVCGHDHPDVAPILRTLEQVYRDQSNYKEANKKL
ncbi:kinesin light chain-like [Sabethes cyaneus]|uniref:kinesin light chain-like n=1 Tax=Sabethes cyaneus TaxID=53552 RepID=UPI00237D855F|nr:kinesin light chain-like [Sabethes cyaneus]